MWTYQREWRSPLRSRGTSVLLRVVVSGDEKALLRCRSTLDEVLSQLSLALKTVGQL